MLPPCGENSCRKKCSEKFSEAQRNEIWDKFWNMDYEARRTWLAANVTEMDKRSRTTNGASRCSKMLIWHFWDTIVCKTFFFNTLGFRSASAVDTALKRIVKVDNVLFCSMPDGRGRKNPANKFPDEYKDEIISHIESYRPQVSHYRLEHAPYRRYLPSELSVKEMHLDISMNLMTPNFHMPTTKTFSIV